MATYLLVNIIFLLGVMVVFKVRPTRPSNACLITLAALLVLTAIFDSLIVAFDIVGYDSSKILGMYVGKAPVEDFFYAILAVILVPTLWNKIGRSNARNH